MTLSIKQRLEINKITALIISNALIYQEILAKKDRRVKPLREFRHSADPINDISDHWKFILSINYYPIFNIAYNCLCSISADKRINDTFKILIETALKIVSDRVALRHDLAGRIYHKLLSDAKYLGAYYTAIPSAVLLTKISLGFDHKNIDWSDFKSFKDFKIADFACGTGTLLLAISDVILDNYIKSCAENKLTPNIYKLHELLVGEILYGFDVLPTAIHLTASTLSLRVPDVPIDVTNLIRMPLGEYKDELGSLEFLISPIIERQQEFHLALPSVERIAGHKELKTEKFELPKFDMCIMNPPFTSSRQPNLLFGNIEDSIRQQMQIKLKKLVKNKNLATSITAGLGSVFIPLADMYLKDNGKIAFVLPRAILSGVAWEKTRKMISDNYDIEYIIVSHEKDKWNFSENTEFSEALLVATKQKIKGAKVNYVNLWKTPKNSIEALSLSSQIMKSKNTLGKTFDDHKYCSLNISEQKYGEMLSLEMDDLINEGWAFPSSFAKTELNITLNYLRNGYLFVPEVGKLQKIKMNSLKTYCDLGPDPRDVYDGFELVKHKTIYPALWGHDSKKIITIKQDPNFYLEPLTTPKPKRPLRKLEDLWPKASNLLIAQRPWLHTKSLMAVLTTRKVLSDVWWPVLIKKDLEIDRESIKKILALWFNSSIAFLIFLGYREETRGPWIQYKKPVLKSMPVIDIESLNKSNINKLVHLYDNVCNLKFKPFPKIKEDNSRITIDDAFSEVLGLHDVGVIRELLSLEPILQK